jgi:hypothetical protein
VIVLVLVCIATATLFAWLLFELGRLMFGVDRSPVGVDRVVHALAGGVRVAGERIRVPVPIRPARWPAPVRPPREGAARSGEGAARSGEGDARSGEGEARSEHADDAWVRHDAEVEEMVRERLYGTGAGLGARPDRPRPTRRTAG